MDQNQKTSEPTSRRAIMRAGIGLLGAGAGLLAASSARAQAPAAQKLDQSSVMYQSHPKNGQLCSICANFIAPNSCQIVAGTINPIGWCVAFAPKA